MDRSETQKALSSSNEVTITVTGRRTGREYSTPVWFVLEGSDIFILPGGGLRSQWYKNAAESKRIRISSGKVRLDLQATAITDPTRLVSVVEKFRRKYGPTYYSDPRRLDAALWMTLP